MYTLQTHFIGDSDQAITMPAIPTAVNKSSNKPHFQSPIGSSEPDLIPTADNRDQQKSYHKDGIQSTNGTCNSQLINSSKPAQAESPIANPGLECSSTPLLPNNNSNDTNQGSVKNMKASAERISHSTSDSIGRDNISNVAISFV